MPPAPELTSEAIARLREEDRQEFLIHAFQALYSGNFYNCDPMLQALIVRQVTDELCTAARTMAKGDQDAFLRHIEERMRRPN